MTAVITALVMAAPATGEQASDGLRPVQAGLLDAGLLHTCAVLDDGTVRCWGNDSAGQIGDGAPNQNRAVPTRVLLPAGRRGQAVSAGGFHACAVLDDGAVWCWGANAQGQLGNGTTTPAPVPVRVVLPVGRTARAISAGGNETCAVLDDGGLWCWGSDTAGELGDGAPLQARSTPSRVLLPAGRSTTAVSVGGGFACAILDDGVLQCWGANSFGQLGDNGFDNRAVPGAVALTAPRRAVALAAGDAAGACAVFATGGVACWGNDEQGAVGNGAPAQSVRAPADIGLEGASAVAAAGHACAAAPFVTLCWGDDFHGQLGNGPAVTADQLQPSVVLGIPAGRAVTAISAGGVGNAPANGGHTCAMYDDGSVICWGDDLQGQLGNGGVLTGAITRPDEGAAALPPGTVAALAADVSLAFDAPPRLAPGRPGTLRLRLRNDGPDAATAVRVLLTPDRAEIVAAAATQGTLAGRFWNAGTVPAGQEAALTLTLLAPTEGEATLTGEVTEVGVPPLSSAPSTRDPDSTPGNGVATEDDQAAVTLRVAPDPVPPGPGGPGGTSGGPAPPRPVVTANAGPCTRTLRGTRRADTLRGTAASERILAGHGRDRLLGGAGADCLYGGAGNDRLEGGAGADTVDGGQGDDVLVGGVGRDRLIGGAGRDLVRARDRTRDVVRCGPGRDRAIVDRGDAVAGCEVVLRR